MAQAQTVAGTIVGLFDDHAQAENAVSALRDAGFDSKQIGIAHQAGAPLPTSETHTDSTSTHRAGEHAGGLWGKVKDFFDGDPVEPYADEKRAGDLASHEVTPGYQGYGREDVRGTLEGMSVPEDRSRYFDHRFGNAESGTLVTVTAPGREAEATRILENNGADLGDAAESYDYAAAPPVANRAEGQQKIQLLGEVLRVHKDRVSRGEVTLRKEVTTEMQTLQVPVTREELVIERHAVAGGTAAGQIGDTGEIRIPLTEETASIDKSTFVREEVSVGKRAVEDVRELTGEVRSEELVVDDQTRTLDDTTTTGSTRK